MDKSLEMEKWEKRGKFEKTLQEKIKNPDLELSLRELKISTIFIQKFQISKAIGEIERFLGKGYMKMKWLNVTGKW